MTEGEALKALEVALTKLRKNCLDPDLICRKILKTLNKVFESNAKFSYEDVRSHDNSCVRMPHSHLYIHASKEVTFLKKQFEFGSSDARYLGSKRESDEISRTSLNLLNRSESHVIGEPDKQAVKISDYYKEILTECTGFTNHEFFVNTNYFTNPSIFGIHCCPDGYLRRGDEFVPVEIKNITGKADDARKKYLEKCGELQEKIDGIDEGEAQLAPQALKKRENSSENTKEKKIPCYARPSNRLPDPWKPTVGLLSNLTDSGPSDQQRGLVQRIEFIHIENAINFKSAFKHALFESKRQTKVHLAVMGVERALMLFWDETNCVIYYDIASRDDEFESEIRTIIENSRVIRERHYAELAPNTALDNSTKSEHPYQMRERKTVGRSRTPRMGSDLMNERIQAASRVGKVSQMDEQQKAALESISPNKAMDSSGSEEYSFKLEK